MFVRGSPMTRRFNENVGVAASQHGELAVGLRVRSVMPVDVCKSRCRHESVACVVLWLCPPVPPVNVGRPRTAKGTLPLSRPKGSLESYFVIFHIVYF